MGSTDWKTYDMEWMLMPLKRYADFSGRSRRKEYWMYSLFQAVIYLVLGVIAGVGMAMGTQGEPGILFTLAVGLIVLAALAMMVPTLAVTVRRFHDQDKSGWFVLLSLIPWIGSIILLVFMCLSGTEGDNRFGPDPVRG